MAIGLITSQAKAVSARVDNGVDQAWIRLRLYENLKSVSISGLNIEKVRKVESFRNVSINRASSRALDIQFQQKWNRTFLITKNENQTVTLDREAIFIKGQQMTIQSQPIADFIQIYKKKSGFDVIAYIKMRDYLKGVVSAEMPINWPSETLKAQIVAARSYALYMKEQRKKYAYDLEASIKDQAYKHTTDSKLEPLMSETAHMVLFNQKNSLFKAYYHSECGGQTSSAKKIFGDSGFDAEVKDPYCRGRSWKLEVSKRELENYIGAFKEILSTYNPLRRAYAVTIQRPDLTLQTMEAQKLRLTVGSKRMKSTWFEMRQTADGIEFKGKGYGHGVGLCQWGSRQMGMMKKNYKEILNFYYPQSMVKTVRSDQLYF